MHRLFLQAHQKYRFLLLLGDIFIIIASFTLISYKKMSFASEPSKFLTITFLVCTLTVCTFYILDLYDLSGPKSAKVILFCVCLGLSIVLICYSALSYFIIFLRPGKINLLIVSIFSGMFTFAWHSSFIRLVKINPRRLLFIGKDPIFKEISEVIQSQYNLYYDIVGQWHRHRHNHTLPDLPHFVTANNIDLIVYSVHSEVIKQIANDLITIKFRDKNLIDAYNFYQRLTRKCPVYYLEELWLLINSQREFFFPGVTKNLKRAFDIFVVLLLLPVAMPLMLIAALAIKLDGKGPIFFIQERLGQNEVPFRLIKFRTMVNNAELNGPQWCSGNDSRITRVGKILRKLRLDELPQFINILKGEMSLVGPRPIRNHFTEMLAKEIPFYKLRLLAKPGLTGWAQIHSGHAHTIEGHSQMLQYDLFYLAHQSLWLDLFILFKTIQVLVWGKGT